MPLALTAIKQNQDKHFKMQPFIGNNANDEVEASFRAVLVEMATEFVANVSQAHEKFVFTLLSKLCSYFNTNSHQVLLK